ncbi:MAG TPA: GyrI-like domain-containing protein [Chitinophagaceae bacterium]|nr:GyrI-like domain-containing protein [Chitinophagaceae bacterium]
MKKIFIGLVLSIAILVVALYLFIPGKIKIEEAIPAKAAQPGVARILSNYNNWDGWWPQKTVFTFNGDQYKPHEYAFDVFNIDIYSGSDTIKSTMELLSIEVDSMAIIWRAEKSSGSNPFERISAYRNARRIGKNISTLLMHMKSFIEKPENIYGIPIIKTKVKDSVLISTRRTFLHRPGVEEINEMIQRLKKYIIANNAVETNHSMLNVRKIDSIRYEAMTAIPVDRDLPNTKEFVTKLMLKGGNILEAEVRGGPYTIETSFSELEHYRSDYKYGSPAIPYQLLVTDRVNEPDTSKWITKLYFPVY